MTPSPARLLCSTNNLLAGQGQTTPGDTTRSPCCHPARQTAGIGGKPTCALSVNTQRPTRQRPAGKGSAQRQPAECVSAQGWTPAWGNSQTVALGSQARADETATNRCKVPLGAMQRNGSGRFSRCKTAPVTRVLRAPDKSVQSEPEDASAGGCVQPSSTPVAAWQASTRLDVRAPELINRLVKVQHGAGLTVGH